MDELPADATGVALALAVAGDAVADLIELAEFLDIDVDHLARPIPFVATGRRGRLQGTQLVEPQLLENTAHGGGRDAGLGGDLLAGPALAAQAFNTVDDGLRCRLIQTMRPRVAILQAGKAFLLVA